MFENQRVERFEVRSGHQLAVRYVHEGDPQKIMFLCHPMPGTGRLLPNLEETIKRDVTLITVDRLGYGLSDPLPKDASVSVDTAAQDLADILEQIATAPVGVAGWSLGGWVAAALAAKRPDLVDRMALIGTPAPDSERAWLLPELRTALRLDESIDEATVKSGLHAYFGNAEPVALGSQLLGVGDFDEKAFSMPNAREQLEQMLEESFVRGEQALLAELTGFLRQPWSFSPQAIEAKTLCLYGNKDPFAPHAHGSWWQKQLNDARLEMMPNVGHMLIFLVWKRVLSYLFPRRRRAK